MDGQTDARGIWRAWVHRACSAQSLKACTRRQPVQPATAAAARSIQVAHTALPHLRIHNLPGHLVLNLHRVDMIDAKFSSERPCHGTNITRAMKDEEHELLSIGQVMSITSAIPLKLGSLRLREGLVHLYVDRAGVHDAHINSKSLPPRSCEGEVSCTSCSVALRQPPSLAMSCKRLRAHALACTPCPLRGFRQVYCALSGRHRQRACGSQGQEQLASDNILEGSI